MTVLIQNADTDLYISFDNERVGELMAETLIEEVPENSEIFMIQGPEADNNVQLTRRGFWRVIDVIDGSSLRWVAIPPTVKAGWRNWLWNR